LIHVGERRGAAVEVIENSELQRLPRAAERLDTIEPGMIEF
jgi:hypothetical protein